MGTIAASVLKVQELTENRFCVLSHTDRKLENWDLNPGLQVSRALDFRVL